ncbi:MAG: serine/threonine protein kinase [Deltaproteobacteria bacterium]|nr:serine/threonine protein kinase [Deltaproteobacteria bacterium]
MEEGKTVPYCPEVPDYRIVRLIGTGGMGSVYAAEKLATHEMFALKLMHAHLAADRAHAARFEREVRILREIRHPNVVEFYEAGLPSADGVGRAYVVMELLEGETLQEMLKRETVLPPALAVSIMLQVLDGLAAAHRAGILHRDMGPSNVFLVPKADGKLRIKLLDFGLARPLLAEDASGAVTQPGTLMGKPAYAAPEQFREQPLVEASDVFACGVMLFKMLTGRLPYRATTAQVLWVERYAEIDSPHEYPSVLEYQPAVPVELAQVVAEAMCRRLERRLPSAREFQKRLLAVEGQFSQEAPSSAMRRLAALKSEPRPPAIHHSSTAAATTTSVQSMVAALRRRRLLVGGVVAAGLALVVLLIVALAGGFGPDGPASAPVAAAPPPEPLVAGADATMPGEVGTPVSGEAARVDGGIAPRDELRVADAARGADVPGTVAAVEVAEPSADASGDAGAPDVVPVTVRFSFTGLPDRAVARVGGTRVGSDGTLEVARSATPVEVRVEVAGGRYQPWSTRLVPDRDRTVRPELRRVAVAAPRDAGSRPRDAGIARVDGGVFATHYP